MGNERITALKIETRDDVELWSRVVWSEGLCPARVVMWQVRSIKAGDARDEWATHIELLAWSGDGFVHEEYINGHYFCDRRKARADFTERCNRL